MCFLGRASFGVFIAELFHGGEKGIYYKYKLHIFTLKYIYGILNIKR